MRPGYTESCARWASGNILLIFDATRCRLQLPSACTSAFDDDYIRISNDNYDLTHWMTFKPTTRFSISWDRIQERRSKSCVTYCRPPSLPLSYSAVLLIAARSFRQRTLPLQGPEAPHSGTAQTTATTTLHFDTATFAAATCAKLESSTWHMVT